MKRHWDDTCNVWLYIICSIGIAAAIMWEVVK